MTAYTYGYSVNSVRVSSTKILSTKQTNVYDSDLELGQQDFRDNGQGIIKTNLWPVHLE